MAYPQYAGNGGIAAAQDDYVDVPFPATVNQYDILVATVLDADDDTFITPTGWNEVATVNGNLQSTVAVFWRRADGTETGVQRFYSNSASGLVMGGVMARYTGCIRTGTPYESLATAGVTFGDTATISAQTTTGIERLIVSNIGIEDDKTIATATGYTAAYHLLETTGSDLALGAQTQQVPNATTITTQTALLEAGISENWATVTFSLIPTTKHALLGGVNAKAAVTGDVKVKKHFEGAVSASSAVSGNLHAHRGLAGAIAAAATVAGAITMQAALTGSISEASTVAGDLKARYQIEGSIDAQSTVYGDLFRIGPTWSLEGHIQEAEDVFGDSMYPVPQWTLIEEFTGTSFGDVMGYDSNQQFLAMQWIPQEDAVLGGIQVWLSQEDKLPEFTPMSGAIWRDGGLGKGPEPWGEIDFSAMTERLADRIVDGTSSTGGALYTFEFGLYDPGKPRVKAGEKYYFIFYPFFGGTSPERTIWWQGNGVFNSRNERWRGDDLGETWTRQWNGTRYIRIFAAQEQIHSLEGHVEAQSDLRGELLKNGTYYVRADGTASSKESAWSPDQASRSMNPTVFSGETFEPGDRIIWSAKGGPYEEELFSNSSSGTSSHPIRMEGEFGGSSRPWISAGEDILSADWTSESGPDRWWRSLSMAFAPRSLVASGVSLGDPGEGQWYYSMAQQRLYVMGSQDPRTRFTDLWVNANEDGIIFDLNGNNWVLEDLYFTMGYRADSSQPCGIDLSGTSGITLRRVGGIGHGAWAIKATGVNPLVVEDIDIGDGWSGIDISDAQNPDGFIIRSSEILNQFGTAVKLENTTTKVGQKIDAVHTGAWERNFSLANMHLASISRCWMQPHQGYGGGWNADFPNGGVFIAGSVTGTIVRNCRVDGHGVLLGGITGLDPFGSNQVTFIHNLVVGANAGAWVWDSGTSATEIFFFNNTVIDPASGLVSFSGSHFRIWVHNNIMYGVSQLDDPQGGMIWDGTAEQGNGLISFAYNTYRDKKDLTFYYKGLGTSGPSLSFGEWCGFTGEYKSYERNPNLENYSAGEYWLDNASAERGSGVIKTTIDHDPVTLALVPGTEWTSVNVADENRYIPPYQGWNRGAYNGDLYLLGSIREQSSLSGNLRVYRDPVSLEGHIGEASILIGDLTILQGGAALPLAGSIGGKSNLYGDLFAPTKWSLEGHIEAQSHFRGDLYTPTRHYLEGHVAAQSALHGLLEQQYKWELAGAVSAKSSLSGDALVTRKIEGHVAAQSALAGDLSIRHSLAGAINAQSSLAGDLKPRRKLEGHIAAQSALTGDLHAHRGLEGHVAGTSALYGDLSVAHNLAGAIEAQSALYGDLEQTRSLEGHIAAQSTVSGALGRIHPLAGAIEAQSTLSGDLTQIEAKWELEGHIAAQSALAGDLIVLQTLAPEDGGAQHAHRSQGAKEENAYVVQADGSTDYILKPGGQLLNLDYISRFGWSVTIFIARDQIPISTEWLRFRDRANGGGGDLVIDESGTGDLYRDDFFFTNGQRYNVKMILDEDSTLYVWVNDSLKWSGSVDSQALGFIHGRISFNASSDQDLEFHSWNYPTLDLLQHHFISIDDATHGHTASEPNLVQNIDLFIDDALHSHTADEPTHAITHHLEINDALHLNFAENVDLTEGISLAIDDASHGHAAEGLDLDQAHVLSIDSAGHGHSAEKLALGGTGYLGINGALHGHTSDNVVLTQAHTLAIDDADHGHQADGVTLDVHSFLSIDDALHGHTAEEPTLSQAHALAIDEALHGHAADEPTLAVTSFLAIDDAIHSHASDNVDLVENIDLVIDGATHGHTADEITIVSHHVLAIDSANHGHTAEELDLIQGITLVIDDAAHSHAADGLTLEEKSLLSIQDAFHLHLAENATLISGIQLVIDDAVHGHTADQVGIAVGYLLEIDDASHSHKGDAVPISTEYVLGISSATHAHHADQVTLDQVHSLAVADALHGHAADELSLDQNSDLVIDSAAHGHTADGDLVIGQGHVLEIEDCIHGHEAEPCNLTPTPVLVIADAHHQHWADVPLLAQQHVLNIDEADHEVTSDEILISQVHYLAIDSCVHEVTSDEVVLTHNHILAIDDATHEHTADELALEQKSYLVIDDALHAVTSPEIEVVSLFLLIDDAAHAHAADEITLLVRYELEIDDALHAHVVDELTFIQHHDLVIDDTIHVVESDELELDTPWYHTQRAGAVAGEGCIVANTGSECITANLDGGCTDIQISPSEEECT